MRLDQVKFLSGIAPDLKARLFGRAREVSFYRESTVVHEGSDAATGYLILEGWMKLVKTAPNGRTVIVDLVGPGEPLGFVAVYDSCPYPVTAVPLSAGRMVTIPRSDVIAVIDDSAVLGKHLFSIASRRLRRSVTTQTMLSAVKVEARLAQLCIELLDRVQEAGIETDRVPRMLTRQEMAEMIGASAETVIRIFSRWESTGIFETTPKFLIIHDRKSLELLLTAGRGE